MWHNWFKKNKPVEKIEPAKTFVRFPHSDWLRNQCRDFTFSGNDAEDRVAYIVDQITVSNHRDTLQLRFTKKGVKFNLKEKHPDSWHSNRVPPQITLEVDDIKIDLYDGERGHFNSQVPKHVREEVDLALILLEFEVSEEIRKKTEYDRVYAERNKTYQSFKLAEIECKLYDKVPNDNPAGIS